ncbi:MAG TPA: VOC family protein [Mucilaginibacter sp.]|nr:VOC family protein [Mucilaginibacter sp.]
MIEFIRADHVNICVPPERLEEARQFYEEVIGLKQIERPDVFPAHGYWFRVADIELHIGTEPAKPQSLRHMAFEVKNVEEAAKLLAKYNVQILEEPVIPGRVRFSFIDPFGNRTELLQMTG